MTSLQPLLNWYNNEKRDLPWRNTQNPYHIWLSEIILQQTRVDQGLPYYLKFVDKYPDIQSLASANDDEVMKLWQGLGYYNRAANMLKTARIIMQDCNGVFPDTYDGLMDLKGIGPYTAAAIASFGFNLPHAVVDGNVYRVLARLFGITEAINSTKGKKIFAALAQELLPKKFAAQHNQAIMEFGALVCKPKQPQCVTCIFSHSCHAYRNNMVAELPVKEKKRQPVKRYFNYLVILTPKKELFIRQRNNEGIWNGLFEFPLIETDDIVDAAGLASHDVVLNLSKVLENDLSLMASVKHQLTHQTIYANFWLAKLTVNQVNIGADYLNIPVEKIHDFAVPSLLERFINTTLQLLEKNNVA
ncbi:MAG: A/G-specific adenine glycosylase [Bacteroidetes bacterium]|nr:MAG: A/G-specific adenine glycosylase [Bacteroidota bacterium]